MQRININTISEAQLRKLERGLPIQLGFHQIVSQMPKDAIGHIYVHPETHKRAAKAHSVKKGLRIQLTKPEVDASGEGFGSMWRWIKEKAAPAVVSAAKWTKKNVIDSPFYQEHIRPELHKAVANLESALPNNAVTRIATSGVDALGEKTGAFGIKGKTKSKKAKGGSFVGGSFVGY